MHMLSAPMPRYGLWALGICMLHAAHAPNANGPKIQTKFSKSNRKLFKFLHTFTFDMPHVSHAHIFAHNLLLLNAP
jgi:hypothetical protein